jgi:hypothetical protein
MTMLAPDTGALHRQDLSWWTEDESKKHEPIWDIVKRIRRQQEYRRLNDLLHASLFGNVPLIGFGPNTYGRPTAGAHVRLSLNIVKNCTAAVVSKIAAKNKIKPTFSTFDGDASLQRKARGLEKFVAGGFYKTKFYKKQIPVFRDGCIFGDGFLKVYPNRKLTDIVADRVPEWEIHVDDSEGFYGEPTCLYHRKYFDRTVAKRMFPGKEAEIEKAQGDPEDIQGSPDVLSDYIPIVEAYHLPSEPGADDGRVTWCVQGSTLHDEPWTWDRFPFAHFQWAQDPAGFFGTGLAYELAGIQAEINDLLQYIQEAHRTIRGFWAVERNSRVIDTHINDDLMKIIRYAGQAPTYIAPTAINPEIYQHLWNLYAKGYEICGISQLSAASQKPAGLNSGAALRAYEDTQTERFLEVGSRLEEFTLDAAELVLLGGREIVQKHGSFKVSAREKRFIEQIDLANVDMPRDAYELQVFPTSMLPSTPAGRIAFVQDMINSKMMSPEDGFDLLNIPDTDKYAARTRAKRELLERNIEAIIEKGEARVPEPLEDHDLAIRLIPEAWAEARNNGVEPARLELLQRYIVLTVRLKKLGLTAIMPPDPVVAPPPGAPPMAPPPAGGPPMPSPPMPPQQQAA